MQFLYVFIGGGFGSICRFLLTRFELPYLSQFPGGTFMSNLISCFILGLIYQGLSTEDDNSHWKLLLAVGFCGGFSTFSTFSLEIFEKLADGSLVSAIAYITASVIFGLIAIYLGIQVMRLF